MKNTTPAAQRKYDHRRWCAKKNIKIDKAALPAAFHLYLCDGFETETFFSRSDVFLLLLFSPNIIYIKFYFIMTTVKVQLNKFRALRDGTYPLVFQIIHRRRKRVVYSPYHLHEETFDQDHSRVVNRRGRRVARLQEINVYIEATLKDLGQVVALLESHPDDFSVSDVVALYRSGQDNSFVVPYLRKLVDTIAGEGRTGTANAYRSTLSRLLRYLGQDESLSFEEITVHWLDGFVSHLSQSGLKINTVNFYLRILRAVYNRAWREEVPGAHFISPFRKIHIGTVRTTKRAVSQECIRQISRERVVNDARLDLARDLFLFSFYSRGMPFVDMAFLRHSDITGDTIRYSRRKTGQPLSVKVTGTLRELIAKYANDGEYVFPILTSGSKTLYGQYQNALRRYNRHLCSLSSALALSGRLTSYAARHSWATIARSNGVPVSVISESLGHGSEKVTYAYLSALDPSVLNAANERVTTLCAGGGSDKRTHDGLVKKRLSKNSSCFV
jgi:integrase